MKLLISKDELEQKSCREPIPLECEICTSIFYKPKSLVLRGLKGTRNVSTCSNECLKKKLSQIKFLGYITLTCSVCGKEFVRTNTLYKNTNTKLNKLPVCSRKCVAIKRQQIWAQNPTYSAKHIEINCRHCSKKIIRLEKDHRSSQLKRGCLPFCSKSCVGKYMSKFRIPYFRSKLEIWIEEKLTEQFPTLVIKYNDRLTIDGELDIYIPSLELAFEINGICHYQPIYGQKVFAYRQIKDKEKIKECTTKRIELYTIDCRNSKFSDKIKSQSYLDFITQKIRERMTGSAPRTFSLDVKRASPCILTDTSFETPHSH